MVALPWEEVTKNRGASFDSLRNVLLHTIDSEDRLVNYVIAGRTRDWVSRSLEEFSDMALSLSFRKDMSERARSTVFWSLDLAFGADEHFSSPKA
jgi:hypothetical protein